MKINGKNVLDVNKDDEEMWWLCILSWRKIWMKMLVDEDAFQSNDVVNTELLVIREDGWKIAKERWNIVC